MQVPLDGVAPDSLPVAAYKEQIIDTLLVNDIIVVVGETGSGKTTQVPQYLLDSARFAKVFPGRSELRIAVTQPRRVAAVAVARRVSQERGTSVSGLVGYTIRFEDRTSSATRLRYMTDGCLLRECLGDPELLGYDVVILDEAHERSLHTDVLFALMKRTLAQRQAQKRTFKILVTSATLDTGQFSAYFNNCPVLDIPGRTFKVDLHYHPISKTQRVVAAVNVALNLHVREGPGHILVFLTGMEECEQATTIAHTKLREMLDAGKQVSDCLIVPLYGMMQSDDQRQVFETPPEGCRKLVFSTNIAETSLTVAGVGFVVDTGYCKQKYFNAKTGMESLVVTEVSQVQATQRAGRAGRTQDGKCFRLFSEESYLRSFQKITVPEILRSNLASVTLQMKALGIDDVVNFDFMEAPDRARLVRSLRTLFLLDALDADGVITEAGKRMAQLPLDPHYARCLLAANDFGCAEEMLTLVSVLSSESIWYRPSRESKEQVRIADEAQSAFVDELGDHMTMLNVYKVWQKNGGGAEWCKRHYLHYRALRQAKDIRGQLADQLSKAGVETGKRGHRVRDRDLLRALCAGFYMQTARMCGAGGGWIITGDNILAEPEGGSALHGASSEWLLFTELVGNTIAHVMMRNVSAVKQEWLAPFLPKLGEVDMKRLVGSGASAKKSDAEGVDKNPEDLAREKAEKLNGARARFLERKRGAKA